MGINYLTGNALEPKVRPTIVCHIVNTVNSFGAGFVVAVTKKYPHVKRAYHDFYDNSYCIVDANGVLAPKGKRSIPFMLGESQIVKAEEGVYVANMVAQKMGEYKGKPPIRYEALRECLGKVVDVAQKLNLTTLSGPRFGAGLSMGDWTLIEEIIKEEVIDYGLNMDIYDLPPKQPNDGFVGRIEFPKGK